jgi:hypothetical protein
VLLGDYRSGGANSVEILGAGDSCPACRKIVGQRFAIDKIPELPYEHCTCDVGCRCVMTPVVKV